MTLIMIIMICIGCALILAGLVYLAVRAIGLAKTAKSAGEAAFAQARALVRGGQQLAPKLQELQRKQKLVADQLKRLSATTRDLQLLRDELSRATDFVTHIKS
jgi:Flp pilus assembly protein TadG